MTKTRPKTGFYEVGVLAIGTGISLVSLLGYWLGSSLTHGCLPVAGVCVPLLFLFLSCLEVVGILTATIVSAVWNTEHAAILLPHAMLAVAATLGLAIVVRLLAS